MNSSSYLEKSLSQGHQVAQRLRNDYFVGQLSRCFEKFFKKTESKNFLLLSHAAAIFVRFSGNVFTKISENFSSDDFVFF